jgi:hypothetical protein
MRRSGGIPQWMDVWSDPTAPRLRGLAAIAVGGALLALIINALSGLRSGVSLLVALGIALVVVTIALRRRSVT